MEKEQIQETAYQGAARLKRYSERAVERVESTSPEAFLFGAALSVGASLLLRAAGRPHDAQFVGQWAPTLLILGLYTKKRYESQGILEKAKSAVEKALH
jgi:hypothetical protein